MPCYTPEHDCIQYVTNNHDELYIRKINEYEAMLCALINELEQRGIANDVIRAACRNGNIDAMSFWVAHMENTE